MKTEKQIRKRITALNLERHKLLLSQDLSEGIKTGLRIIQIYGQIDTLQWVLDQR